MTCKECIESKKYLEMTEYLLKKDTEDRYEKFVADSNIINEKIENNSRKIGAVSRKLRNDIYLKMKEYYDKYRKTPVYINHCPVYSIQITDTDISFVFHDIIIELSNGDAMSTNYPYTWSVMTCADIPMKQIYDDLCTREPEILAEAEEKLQHKLEESEQRMILAGLSIDNNQK